jgi:dienelactone hydrolase
VGRTGKLFSTLTRRGPHQVLRGDLAFAGIAGVVYTPARGYGLPAVAFGHDWLCDTDDYTETCRHLASWGIVAAAPNTQRGPVPSVLNLSTDLGVTLDVMTGVRLGPGEISVAPAKLALAGHGFGASAAILAASARQSTKAVVAVFPAVTKPSAEAAAAGLKVPGLVLATPDDDRSIRTDAVEIAERWAGSVLRVVDKSQATSLAEEHGLSGLLGVPRRSTRVQKTVRALMTGFLLFQLTGDKTYREFADPEATFRRTSTPDAEAPAVTQEERIVSLFR